MRILLRINLMVQRGRKDLIPLPDYKVRKKKNEKISL